MLKALGGERQQLLRRFNYYPLSLFSSTQYDLVYRRIDHLQLGILNQVLGNYLLSVWERWTSSSVVLVVAKAGLGSSLLRYWYDLNMEHYLPFIERLGESCDLDFGLRLLIMGLFSQELGPVI
jgi:hypothetical protein